MSIMKKILGIDPTDGSDNTEGWEKPAIVTAVAIAIIFLLMYCVAESEKGEKQTQNPNSKPKTEQATQK